MGASADLSTCHWPARMCTRVSVCACVCARVCRVRPCAHTCTRVGVCTCVHARVSVCACVCTHVCHVRPCAHTCGCVCECVQVCVWTCVCGRVWTSPSPHPTLLRGLQAVVPWPSRAGSHCTEWLPGDLGGSAAGEDPGNQEELRLKMRPLTQVDSLPRSPRPF